MLVAMILTYGTYAFPFNSVQMSAGIETVWNAGGQPYSQRKSLHVNGILPVVGQDNAALVESLLRAALAVPFQDLLFRNDDGTLSALQLPNLGSLTGVRIKSLRFPKTNQAELATVRSFEFEAEAEYPLPNTAALLLEFSETVTFEGGQPIFRHRLAISGPNQKQLVYPQDTFRAKQSGKLVAYRNPTPLPPPPLWPYALKQGPHLSAVSPKRMGQVGFVPQYQGYALDWNYEFEDIAPLIGAPHLWT